jgi:hypothetical protein
LVYPSTVGVLWSAHTSDPVAAALESLDRLESQNALLRLLLADQEAASERLQALLNLQECRKQSMLQLGEVRQCTRLTCVRHAGASVHQARTRTHFARCCGANASSW